MARDGTDNTGISYPSSENDSDSFATSVTMVIGDQYLARVAAVGDLVSMTFSTQSSGLPYQNEVDQLPPEQRNDIYGALEEFANLLSKVRQGMKDNQTPNEGSVSLDLSDPHLGDLIGRIILAGARKARSPDRRNVLNRSLLVLAVSDIEVLVGEVASAIMRAVPGTLQPSEASLTLAQLMEVGSVEAATGFVIEQRAEDLLRGDLADWRKWFDRFGVKLTETTDDWPKLAEIFARRNLVVHNDSKVNRRYVAKLREAGLSVGLPDLNERIEIDASYLREALGRLSAMGVLLCGGAAIQFRRSYVNETLSWLLNSTKFLAELELFLAALTVSTTVLGHSRGRLHRETELGFKIQRWIAMRELGMATEVAAELAEWDVSGLDQYYHHVRSALLGDCQEVVRTAHLLLKSGGISYWNLKLDVLYGPLRQEPAFETLLQSSPAETPTNKIGN